MRRTRAAALAVLVLAACADDGSPDRAGSAVIATTTIASMAQASPVTAADGSPVTSSLPTVSAPPESVSTVVEYPPIGDPRVAAVEVARFDQPVDLVARPADDALYVVEKVGRVVRFDGTDAIDVADVSDRISSGGEQGLLGLEFSPQGDFAYLDYTDRDGATVVAEYPIAPDGAIDVGAERVLLTVPQPYANHNGGDLATGPDGMLYIALGDGGSANDPQRRAGDPRSLLGSLLRIDPTPSATAPYTIPPDNPFADGSFEGVEGAPEIWAWGLRNPWKIAFDPVTDDLWVADVGQNRIEEVNLVSVTDGMPAGRGVNFGWSAFEGTDRFNADVDADSWAPSLTYLHGDDGCSISGGVPYRGTAIPELEPAYVYSDYCSGKVWALDLAGGRNLSLLDGFHSVSAVRAGPDGELYVLELTGKLYRLVAG